MLARRITEGNHYLKRMTEKPLPRRMSETVTKESDRETVAKENYRETITDKAERNHYRRE